MAVLPPTPASPELLELLSGRYSACKGGRSGEAPPAGGLPGGASNSVVAAAVGAAGAAVGAAVEAAGGHHGSGGGGSTATLRGGPGPSRERLQVRWGLAAARRSAGRAQAQPGEAGRSCV